MKALTIEQTKEMLIKACEAIMESLPLLTEIDSKIGDGDHGIGMAGGMEKAKAALEAQDSFSDVNALFKLTGRTMLMSMGGASGVIFGTMFSGGVKKVEPKKELDGETLTQLFYEGLKSIKERGKAEVGDKTMVDALEPAVIAMQEAPKDDLASLLKAGMESALQGVENTKNYVAKFGRAKSLMERSIGYQDAGATSVSIIFKAMYDYVASL